MQIYLAGPLFTLAEQRFNEALADEIARQHAGITVFLPQERAKQFLGKPDQNANLFADCVAGVRASDAIVAILDGADADSGTSVEIGLAHGLGKPILGLRTDFRISEEQGLNLMVALACTRLVVRPELTLEAMAGEAIRFVRAV